MQGTLSKPRLTRGAGVRGIVAMAAVVLLVGCHHGSSSNGSYTIGGTITGLTAGSVVLSNDTTTVTVAANATTWVFPGSFEANSAYSVAVLTQPAGELCEVTANGTGTALTADISTVTVVCNDYGQWIWEAGLSSVDGSGVYGTQGASSASNLPGARYSGSSWIDTSNDLWLFGGVGYDANGAVGDLNDLWRYSPSTGQWTWVSGGTADNAAGVYGTQGTAAVTNLPGGRYAASSWTDAAGNLWLFGGYGYPATGSAGYLNDLWRYSPGSGQWTWVNGGNADNAAGVYGTQGAAAVTNLPGARYAASSWTDAAGNLWLFGGIGYSSTGVVGTLNDLWQYSTSTGQWTWISGGSSTNAAGVYGTEGSGAATNVPGARQAATAWTDSSGNLWLFGGYGYDSTQALGYLNDLWQYSPTSGLWTWVSGGSGNNASAVYGIHGSPAATNVPGARQAASAWTDSSGDLWLFGGVGYDSGGNLGDLSDLWKYSLSTAQWTWVSGSNTPNAAGAYGIQGTVSSSAAPGARYSANSWFDSSGNLYLFGGAGDGSTGNGYLNDLWLFQPP